MHGTAHNNLVTLRRAGLVLRWVTVSEECNQITHANSA